MIHLISLYLARASRCLLVAIMAVSAGNVFANQAGKQLFQENCAACHTIGGGRLVGPDLKDVQQRRTLEWLQAFVQSPQSIIDGGDQQAVALFKEFNNMPMPPPAISTAQIDQVLEYISADNSEEAVLTTTAATNETLAVDTNPEASANEEDIALGRDIFQGVIRLVNGGPACNACHDVKHDAVIGGGILARELTAVFSRMGGPAVRSILGSAPFPVMKTAYLKKPLNKEEISALVAFFENTDKERSYQQPKDYGIGLFISGVIGAVLLLIFYSLLWSRRKKNSVNQEIYDRQLKSQ